MSANPTDPWEEALRQAQEAIDKGTIPVISRKRGEGVVDPRDQFAQAPAFPDEARDLLPKIFTDYVQNRIALYGGDPGTYAVNFMAMHCAAMHSSVKMQNNPLDPDNWRNPNDFALTVGKSGQNKSGLFKDITRFQRQWQQVMDKAAGASVGSARRAMPPACYMQGGSVEGLMRQVADNKGKRLLLASDEAMGFYGGAAIHHKEMAAQALSDVVTVIYDGGMYSKRLVNSAFSVPEALATLVMTTTIDKLTGWQAFPMLVSSGMMARHTVAMMSHVQPDDETRLLPEADKAMSDFMFALRGLENFRFALAEDAHIVWRGFRRRKEVANQGIDEVAHEGLLLWARKYEMRIMTMATVLQCYDYITGGKVGGRTEAMPPDPNDHSKVTEARVLTFLEISRDNLARAVAFVEGYLYDTQEFFYQRAKGVTEFGDEMINFLAYRVTSDEPDNPDCRIIHRDYFTNKGPAVCRGGMTPALKELHGRYIQALLDHGFVEVYHDHPKARNLKKVRADNEMTWYKVRDEVFEMFNSDDDRNWLRAHFERSRLVGDAKKRIPLSL